MIHLMGFLVPIPINTSFAFFVSLFSMSITVENIVSEILKSKPGLPGEDILNELVFKWNDEELDEWDGGQDVHEKIREEVVLLLQKLMQEGDQQLAEAWRFLLQHEVINCSKASLSMPGLRVCYDELAALKQYQDLELLMEALTASFDSSVSLFKNRLFYLGHDNVLNYLQQKETDPEIIEQFQYYATIQD